MKSVVSVLALFAALGGGSALAADLPSRKAAPVYTAPEPVALWNGFYVGLNAGGTFGGSQSANTTAGDLMDPAGTAAGAAFAASAAGQTSTSTGGFIGGGQVGYNYQFNKSFVAGLEADIQGVSGGGTATSVGFAADPLSGALPLTTTQVQKSLDYLGTVRGRIGYLVTPTLLVYATGGLAYGGVNLNTSFASVDAANIAGPGFGSSSYSDTRVGYTVGGGLEWMFLPNWSAKLEYLYYDLGSVSNPQTAIVDAPAALGPWAYTASTSSRFDGHIVRAGVNYHFNWSAAAPVLAKY